MGVNKERLSFLKWRNIHYPLLKSEHSDSNFLWQAWQGRAAEIVEVKKPSHNKQMATALSFKAIVLPGIEGIYMLNDEQLQELASRLNSALKEITKA